MFNAVIRNTDSQGGIHGTLRWLPKDPCKRQFHKNTPEYPFVRLKERRTLQVFKMPVHYVILHNESNLLVNTSQEISYKLWLATRKEWHCHTEQPEEKISNKKEIFGSSWQIIKPSSLKAQLLRGVNARILEALELEYCGDNLNTSACTALLCWKWVLLLYPNKQKIRSHEVILWWLKATKVYALCPQITFPSLTKRSCSSS